MVSVFPKHIPIVPYGRSFRHSTIFFQYVLNAKAVSLSFAQDPMVQGDDIVVSWNLDGAKVQHFTLQLFNPNTLVDSLPNTSSDHLLDSQSVNPNGNGNGQLNSVRKN